MLQQFELIKKYLNIKSNEEYKRIYISMIQIIDNYLNDLCII
jgi:hypothetical protein